MPNLNINLPGDFGRLLGLLAVVVAVMAAIVHLAFAFGVGHDAYEQERRRTGPLFVSALIWTLATLLGGVFVAGVYWAMHHSALRRTDTAEPATLKPSGSPPESEQQTSSRLF